MEQEFIVHSWLRLLKVTSVLMHGDLILAHNTILLKSPWFHSYLSGLSAK